MGALLVFQLYLLGAHKITVPAFVLRSVETRLAASRLTVHFGRAVVDPSGHIVVENVRLGTPAFAEPLFTARALYVRLDPWLLLTGQVRLREIRAAGASLLAPAMFSPTGRAEAIANDCDLVLTRRGNRNLECTQWVCELGQIIFTAHGVVRLSAPSKATGAGLPELSDFLTGKYPALSRELVGSTAKFSVLDEPQLHAELTPSERYGALVTGTLTARSLHNEKPWPIQATELRITARAPLLGSTAAYAFIDSTAARLSLTKLSLPGISSPLDMQAQTVRARLRGVIGPGFQFAPRETEITASSLAGFSFQAENFSAHLLTTALPHVQADILARLEGGAVSLLGAADLKNKNAQAHFHLAVASTLLAPLGRQMHRDLADLLELKSPLLLQGNIELTDGWHLARLTGTLAGDALLAQGVPLDAVQAKLELAGHDLRVTEIVLRQHDNLAQGDYTMDTATQDYRFLLTGRLRPLEIAGWFQPRWAEFWKNFDFSAAPAAADVDVRGRWGSPDQTDVFVFADARSPLVRGVQFDRVRVILRMLHDFYDGREVLIAHGARTATGHFKRMIDPDKDQWSRMDFDVTSNLDLAESARLFGQAGEEFISPFKFAQPPTLHASGTLNGPASPGGEHRNVQLTIASTGDFSLYDFPLSDISVDATLRDDDIDLPRVTATFAGGALAGEAYLSGPDDTRRLRFDVHLANASLGHVVTTVDEFIARQKNVPPDPPTKFVQHASDIRLDLTTSAEGRYHSPLSFSGHGAFDLAGAELGQIRLLGKLSELLSFTSLRFTAARANFIIDKTRLLFPNLKITGANSAVDASGAYLLDKKKLDINAKVYPFGESKLALPNLVGLALMPLSAALEVKLTGTLADPSWAFTYGPSNFLRKILPANSEQSRPPAPAQEKK
ncbi:MAG: hypothetical protein KGJ37_00600 [Verrucomicrobiota bacterium]|nr:hypothetical protein [Verrucomicrobiota bacterium]